MMRAPRAVPAALNALDPGRTPGSTQPLVLSPKRVHALGLTYAAHINETGGEAGGPAVFAKEYAFTGLAKEQEVP